MSASPRNGSTDKERDSAGGRLLDTFSERLMARAATIDDLLSDDFETLPGQKGDTDLAAQRLAAWCRSCASGDWLQFGRRLGRDGWDYGTVLSRFASVRHRPAAPVPAWVDDALWIAAALGSPLDEAGLSLAVDPAQPCAFEHLLAPVVKQAEDRLLCGVEDRAIARLNNSARANLRLLLLQQLSALCTPAVYAVFDKARQSVGPPHDMRKPDQRANTSRYEEFVAQMQSGGLQRLLAAKPVLLRLIATITRQWINVSCELITRLDDDLPAILDLVGAESARVATIEGDLGDPHNGGRSVRVVAFEDGTRIVYKPKDLRVDLALHTLVERLNRATPPSELRAVRTLAREGYGWSEFIEHAPCAGSPEIELYFRRAGGWLALFYCLAAGDVHQENLIAAGAHPVPIDTETILQAVNDQPGADDPESEASRAALEIIANSVMTVGLIPSYRRNDSEIYAIGGLISDWNTTTRIHWDHINTDLMRPARSTEAAATTPNLPYADSTYARFADHADAFIEGFRAYVKFLANWSADPAKRGLFDGFASLPVRRVPRPTRFYAMLLERLKDHRSMDDGVVWSAQADFAARLANWEQDTDPRWPSLGAERSALVTLNVPYFQSLSDDTEVRDAVGLSIPIGGLCGLDRARERVQGLNEHEIDWQVTVIRQNLESIAGQNSSVIEPVMVQPAAGIVPTQGMFLAEADAIAAELSRYAIRRGPGAAWLAMDWSGDSEQFQLVNLGPTIYNGVSGIGLFLAAHAAVTGSESSRELALAGVVHLRKELGSRNAAPLARSLGVGGGVGLGSIVYALTAMSQCLRDDALLVDAHVAAALITDDLIASDRRLDVIGGSAGAILGLLRLYRDTQSGDVLARGIKCGEHLLRQPRQGSIGQRTWRMQTRGLNDLNGMSHGAAGYAYALASLAVASGRKEFADAAMECVAFENVSYDPQQCTWPAVEGEGQRRWPSQWCHGAPGIGLARIGMASLIDSDTGPLIADIDKAVTAVELGWPDQQLDTLCCGALASIEFFHEAAAALGRQDLRDLASQRLTSVLSAATNRGNYRWSGGARRFNPGLFRGLAGVGYTTLREIDEKLPNVLLWQ